MFLEPQQVWVGGRNKNEMPAVARSPAIFGGGDGFAIAPTLGGDMAVRISKVTGVIMFRAGAMIEPARIAGEELKSRQTDI